MGASGRAASGLGRFLTTCGSSCGETIPSYPVHARTGNAKLTTESICERLSTVTAQFAACRGVTRAASVHVLELCTMLLPSAALVRDPRCPPAPLFAGTPPPFSLGRSNHCAAAPRRRRLLCFSCASHVLHDTSSTRRRGGRSLTARTLTVPCRRRRASKKAGGSTQNGKDSNPKMLGVKMYGNEWCRPGNIVMRQRGTEFHPGPGMGMVCLIPRRQPVCSCCQPLASASLVSRSGVHRRRLALQSLPQMELKVVCHCACCSCMLTAWTSAYSNICSNPFRS